MGASVFFMQVGFLCLEAGYVDQIWSRAVIKKNVHDIAIGGAAFLLIGYSVATFSNPFQAALLLDWNSYDIGILFVSTGFAVISVTIMSGAVLERLQSFQYVAWGCLITIFNYSITARWVWSDDGWLNKLGFVDAAGCTAVHMVGSIGGGVAIYFLGPRFQSTDRYGKLKPRLLPGHNSLLMAVGVGILWFGWFAFNVSSPLLSGSTVSLEQSENLATIAMLTFACPIFSGITGVIYTVLPEIKSKCRKKKRSSRSNSRPSEASNEAQKYETDVEDMLNALLFGMVGITACNNTIGFGSCIFIGLTVPIAGFWSADMFRNKLKLDDPLGVLPVHFAAAAYSLIAEGVCNSEKGIIAGKFNHFFVQCLGTVVVCAFNLVLCILMWKLLIAWLLDKDPLSLTRISKFCTFYGVNLALVNPDLTLKELLESITFESWFVLIKFREYCHEQKCTPAFEFLLYVTEYRYQMSKGLTRTADTKKRFDDMFKLICEKFIDVKL